MLQMKTKDTKMASPDPEPILEAKGLSLRISTDEGEIQVVEDVSFQVGRGQVVALVGESGAGKSITALSLLRLLPMPPIRIAAGEALLNGNDLLTCSLKQMRGIRGNEVSMIFQEPMTALNPALRVGRQIAEPLVRHKKMSWRAAERRAVELLSEVQVPDAEHRVRDYPHQFSGGMRQRVMIAIAMACQPQMIIADEPTTALDVTVQAQILELLIKLTSSSGGGLLLITHDLGVVARYADYVNIMYAGRIVEQGETDSVYNNPAHPYTRGLLASVPNLKGEMVRRLDAIPGQAPTLLSDFSGCAFADRCLQAQPQCRQDRPQLEIVSKGHHVACWVGSR